MSPRLAGNRTTAPRFSIQPPLSPFMQAWGDQAVMDGGCKTSFVSVAFFLALLFCRIDRSKSDFFVKPEFLLVKSHLGVRACV